MEVMIITEVDLESGEYKVTFRNKSNPGEPMDLKRIQAAYLKVAKDFVGGKSEEIAPGVLLA